MNPFSVEGKLALVTGATPGIGLGAARALAQSGADVVLVGRDEDELESAATELRQASSQQVHVVPFDLLETKAIAGWVEGLCETFGTPDILGNLLVCLAAAGLSISRSMTGMYVLALNTTAIFEVSRSFARRRIAEGVAPKSSTWHR